MHIRGGLPPRASGHIRGGPHAQRFHLETGLPARPPQELDTLEYEARCRVRQPVRRAQEVGLRPFGHEPAVRGDRTATLGLGCDLDRLQRQVLGRPEQREAQGPGGRCVALGCQGPGRAALQARDVGAQPLTLRAGRGELIAGLVTPSAGGKRDTHVDRHGREQETEAHEAARHGAPPAQRARTTLRISASRASGPGSTSRRLPAASSLWSRRSQAAASRATTSISRAPPRA